VTWLPLLTGGGIGVVLTAILAPVRMIFTGQLVTRREHEGRMSDLRAINETTARLAEVQGAQLAEILSAIRSLAGAATTDRGTS
jgi:hypothetical protein